MGTGTDIGPQRRVSTLDRELAARLDVLAAQGLRRELRRVDSPIGPRVNLAGRTLLSFASNDYLGLASHPALQDAAARAARDWGAGSGASRLICGSLAPHLELEESLAHFKGTDAALSFSSGYATAVGTLSALLGKDDVVILDKLVHACLVDGARLSGATIRVFRHNDLDRLESLLRWAQGRQSRALVVTESVFSMDGDIAPLREIVTLKERYGAWLLVDEAHATGVFGTLRRGLAEALGVSDHVEIQMGTLGKALGAAGGYIAGSRVLVDYLVNRARSFIFSTAPVPAQAAAATAALELMQSAEGAERCARLWARIAQAGRACPRVATPASAILPLILGAEDRAVAAAQALLTEGFFVPAIRYPTVARGQARLRVSLSAAHTEADVDALGAALQSALQNLQTP